MRRNSLTTARSAFEGFKNAHAVPMVYAMARRLAAWLPRLVALTLIWLLASSTMTLAAAGRKLAERTSPASRAHKRAPETLIVPDVRRQAYVFAKGILEDAGFAWQIEGSVRGFAANVVAVQTP